MLVDLTGRYEIDSIEMLHDLAQRVADNAEAGDVLLLVGDLGSGKTAFVRELAQVLQVGEMVTSPTFTVAAEYDVPHGHVLNQLVHVDLYRLGEQARKIVAQEDKQIVGELLVMAQQLKRLVVIEWADLLPDDLEPNHWQEQAWQFHFKYGEKEQGRVITIKKLGHPLKRSDTIILPPRVPH